MPGAPGPMPQGGCISWTCFTGQASTLRRSSRLNTDSAARRTPGSMSQVRSMHGRTFPSARSTTATRNVLLGRAMRLFDVLVGYAGCRIAALYLLYLDVADDGCLRRFRPPGRGADRPNPNGHIIDGPVLDSKYWSGVGAIPVPVLHGLTMGEIACMAAGQDGRSTRPDRRNGRNIHPCDRIPPACGSVAQLADRARRYLCRAVPFRRHRRQLSDGERTNRSRCTDIRI